MKGEAETVNFVFGGCEGAVRSDGYVTLEDALITRSEFTIDRRFHRLELVQFPILAERENEFFDRDIRRKVDRHEPSVVVL